MPTAVLASDRRLSRSRVSRLRFVLPLMVAALSATAAVREQPTSLDAMWSDLCAYDVDQDGTRSCERLKTSGGEWRTPSPRVLAWVASERRRICRAARSYRVDPRAVAGVIVAEQSLNVDWTDAVEDWLAPGFGGGAFSCGPAQLRLRTALAVEPTAARTERRRLRSGDQVADAISDARAVNYVAAIMAEATAAYARHGMRISSRPEILATLYNVGEWVTRASEAERLGRAPRPNYMGLFVLRWLETIASRLGSCRAGA
jgi:hypothetical protein